MYEEYNSNVSEELEKSARFVRESHRVSKFKNNINSMEYSEIWDFLECIKDLKVISRSLVGTGEQHLKVLEIFNKIGRVLP